MKNEEYVKFVEEENYPTEPTVELASKFEDERGVIQNLLNTPINHIAVIDSKAGAIRSNHYHKLNSHYIFVVSGEIEYHERFINGTNVIIKKYGPGEMFFTGPQKVHKFVSLTDSKVFTFAKNFRGEQHDEQDTVKAEF